MGVNVGGIAGLGAVLFGPFAESTCTALALAAWSPDLRSSCGATCMCAYLLRGHMRWDGDPHLQGVVGKVDGMPNVENALMGMSVISTVLLTRWSLASLGVVRRRLTSWAQSMRR